MITLSHEELLEMYRLVDKRAKKLHTKHKDLNLLLRDGLVKSKVINKSVNHLHFHLLPDVGIHIQTPKQADNREWLEDKAYTTLAKNIKKRFGKKTNKKVIFISMSSKNQQELLVFLLFPYFRI